MVTVFTMTTVTLLPLQLSTAVGGSNAQVVPHSTVLLLAQVITGGMVSRTVRVAGPPVAVPKLFETTTE